MSRLVGIFFASCALTTGAPRSALAERGGHGRERGGAGAAAAVHAYASAYVHAAFALTPTYARQTGLACSACHTHFPELTATGRAFKLNGYVFRRSESLEGKNPEGDQSLLLNLVAPVSLMVQTSYTSTKKTLPGTQNGTVVFPDQLSIFTGGEITPHVGGFLQITIHPQTGQLGVDNSDFRYATHTNLLSKRATLGLSLNNNPTVQDIWNSTPAWRFPYASSSVAPTPRAVTLVDGTLAQTVAGLTAYTMWNDRVYAEFGMYRSAPLGVHRPFDSTLTGVIDGGAPYWRLAFPNAWGNDYLSIGAYGMAASIYPAGVVGPTNRFTDVAVDLAFMHSLGSNSFTLDGSWIHEQQAWRVPGAAANPTNTLRTFRAAAMYHIGQRYAFTLAPFVTTGSSDTLLYAPGPVIGSRTRSPNNDGLITEVDFMPWQNLRLQFQYVLYNKFNGSSSNYDGFGRQASDNNTLYIVTWLLY
jgi:hypothetical protein